MIISKGLQTVLLGGAAQAVGVTLLTWSLSPVPWDENAQRQLCDRCSHAHTHENDVDGSPLCAQKWGQGSDSRGGAALVLLWPQTKADRDREGSTACVAFVLRANKQKPSPTLLSGSYFQPLAVQSSNKLLG